MVAQGMVIFFLFGRWTRTLENAVLPFILWRVPRAGLSFISCIILMWLALRKLHTIIIFLMYWPEKALLFLYKIKLSNFNEFVFKRHKFHCIQHTTLWIQKYNLEFHCIIEIKNKLLLNKYCLKKFVILLSIGWLLQQLPLGGALPLLFAVNSLL